MDQKAQVTSLADLDGRAVITVSDAASLLGICRSAAYEAVRRHQLPVIRIGSRMFVPVPRLLALLTGQPVTPDGYPVAVDAQ